MNWLEEQLKSWEPRRPSAKIERRLFGGQRRAAAELTRAIAWLAPAAACMVLALAAARPGAGASGVSRPESMFAMMMMSNRASASVLCGNGAQPENSIVRASFQWTNKGDSGSSIRFIPFTNSSY
jgi:hypothetical protein